MDRSEKQSMLCPNCRRLINRDEPVCPYCGLSRPGSGWKRILPSNLLQSPYDMIRIIIYVNVALYILALLLNPRGLGLSANPLAFLSPSNHSLLLLGATGTLPIDRLHGWWTLVSASYLHGGLLHIVFNMIALNQLGTLAVQAYGPQRMVILYALTGLAGYAASYAAGVSFTIGASAAVCGLIGALLYYGKSRGGLFGDALFRQVMGWLVGLFIIGLMPNINNWGHGAGILSGVALGFFLGYPERRPTTFLHKAGATLCIAGTLLLLAKAIGGALSYRLLG